MLFEVTGLTTAREWCLFAAVLWACYLLAEQQTISLLMVVHSSFTAALASLYIAIVCLVLGSGSLRSYRGLPDWLMYLTYGTQTRYAGAFLSQQLFSHASVVAENCSMPEDATNRTWSLTCRYPDSVAYLKERYGRENSEFYLSDILDSEFNLSLAFAFPISLAIANCLLYLVPLPAFTKSKFRA
ncbi:ATP-binding cassette sub- G member 5 [Homalodisca vitripennis]|nr:ATP-binding cassette sub- G member 5 [Homalodisca vitripennis]